MKQRLLGFILVVVLGASVVAVVCWLRSGPSWQISITATNGKSIITITTTTSKEPVYIVVIKGWNAPCRINHLSRTEIAANSIVGFKTVFSDETIPPGRWTMKIDNVKVDIMPARLVVNDSFEFAPQTEGVVDID